MSKSKPILIVLAFLLAVGASVALAASDWEGSASGICGGMNPFAPWQGTLDETIGPHDFVGFWGNDQTNIIYGDVDSTVSGVKWLSGKWYYQSTQYGSWNGYFDEARDDAQGYWWSDADSSSCNGTWWGNLAD